MTKIRSAFLRGECIQEFPDTLPYGLDGPFICLADHGLKLGEHHLDGVEIGAVGRQKEQMGADLAEGLACGFCFVASQVIEDDPITGGERRSQGLLHPGGEGRAIDGSIPSQQFESHSQKVGNP